MSLWPFDDHGGRQKTERVLFGQRSRMPSPDHCDEQNWPISQGRCSDILPPAITARLITRRITNAMVSTIAVGILWAALGWQDANASASQTGLSSSALQTTTIQESPPPLSAAPSAAAPAYDRSANYAPWMAAHENPFNIKNLVHWLFDHATKLITILIATFGLHWLLKIGCRQIAAIMARGGSRGTQRERENRAVTLVGVFRNTASLAIIGGGTLMALDEVGIPIMPLMGGAAVLGLAVAFGAQNLVRDYFSGFMVLMEDQYGINDVVRIGDISGVVEKITLRITVLRDLEGIVHFVPHGSITRVSNLTHGWSRAVVEINISYREDPDHVMKVLMDVANELRKDPAFGPLILDEPEMLGVDRFGDYSIVLKFVLKTHPLKRWPVRRELLRRIKRRFDELGIEIPFPQRTVYNRQEAAPVAPAADKSRPAMYGRSA